MFLLTQGSSLIHKHTIIFLKSNFELNIFGIQGKKQPIGLDLTPMEIMFHLSPFMCVLRGIKERWAEIERERERERMNFEDNEFNTFISVQFSRSVVFDSLRPHEPQHTRPPCPSPTHGVHPNPCPLSRWCRPTISFSVVPFSSCPQSFRASGSFELSQLFASGGQTIEVSASTAVLPMNTQDWSLGWTGWIALQSKGLSRVFFNTTVQKHQFFIAQLSSQSNSRIHTWPL